VGLTPLQGAILKILYIVLRDAEFSEARNEIVKIGS
jgi:hypothetical protein